MKTPLRQPRNHAKIIRYAVIICSSIALAVTVVLNWQPYLGMARTLVESITEIPLVDLLSIIPGVGLLISLLGMVVSQIFGVALWGLIQILEILPAWIKGELNALVSLIFGMSNIPQMVISPNDSEAVANLKEQYNNAPSRWLKTARMMAIGAYLVDGLLCLLRFPPYQGGLVQFWEDVQLGVQALDAILWNNVWSAIATMFGFEAVLYLLVWVSQGLRYFMTPPAMPKSAAGGPGWQWGAPPPGAAPPQQQTPRYASPNNRR